jgi:hypothetical protein
MDNKSDLQRKLNDLIAQDICSEKYCHLKSVSNFIYSYDKINATEKERVFLLLDNYLEIIKEQPAFDATSSLELFNEFIRPIGVLYQETLSFMPMINLWVVGFWLFVLFIGLYIFHVPIVGYFIAGIPIFSYYMYVFIKRVNKKVYGFMF